MDRAEHGEVGPLSATDPLAVKKRAVFFLLLSMGTKTGW
jgi:hypothetical protein